MTVKSISSNPFWIIQNFSIESYLGPSSKHGSKNIWNSPRYILTLVYKRVVVRGEILIKDSFRMFGTFPVISGHITFKMKVWSIEFPKNWFLKWSTRNFAIFFVITWKNWISQVESSECQIFWNLESNLRLNI